MGKHGVGDRPAGHRAEYLDPLVQSPINDGEHRPHRQQAGPIPATGQGNSDRPCSVIVRGSDVALVLADHRAALLLGRHIMGDPCCRRPVLHSEVRLTRLPADHELNVAAWADVPDLAPTAAVDTTVNGYTGKEIELTVPDYASGECRANQFGLWRVPTDPSDSGDSPGYWAQGPKQHLQTWVLDIDGTRLVISWTYLPSASPEERAALDAASASFQIGWPLARIRTVSALSSTHAKEGGSDETERGRIVPRHRQGEAARCLYCYVAVGVLVACSGTGQGDREAPPVTPRRPCLPERGAPRARPARSRPSIARLTFGRPGGVGGSAGATRSEDARAS